MIVIHVQVKVKPEQRGEFILQAVRERDVAHTHAGCAKYEWSVDVQEPEVFTLYEEWDTQAAFDAYKASEQFKQMGHTLMPLLAESPQSSYYAASLLPS